MQRTARCRGLGHPRKKLRGIDRIKAVLRAAKITTHLDLTLLRQDALDLIGAQATDHVAHTLPAA